MRRSRFKVAASIPVRRKPGVAAEKEEDTAQANPIVKEENEAAPVEASVKETPVPKAAEQVIKTEDPPPAASTEPKPFFKRIKPPIQLPIKKQRPRPNAATKPDVPASELEAALPTDQVVAEAAANTPNLLESAREPITENSHISAPIPSKPDEAPPPVTVNKEEIPRAVTPPPAPQPSILLSPTKSPARPRFIRPALLESSVRRHSVHASSASESEDDTRRVSVTRTRKVSESALQVRNQVAAPPTSPAPPPPPTAPTDETFSECTRLAMMPKRKRPKISNFVRKLAEARRDFKKRFAKEKPERSNLKMFDLIFYNPEANSMDSKTKEVKEEGIISSVDRKQALEEEEVDDPDKEEENDEKASGSEEVLAVPQVKIGANGEIILDEKSLVIETTEARKGREAFLNSVPVFEDRNRRMAYYGKKQNPHKYWTPIETKCFYKALNSIGTDFAMMQSLFPGRTRGELKKKFKREEKTNGALIDDALGKPSAFNLKILKEELDNERAKVEEETQRQLEEKQKLEQQRKEKEELKRLELKSYREDLKEKWGESGAALFEFVGHSVDVVSDKSLRRSSRKGSVNKRKICDFVDPDDLDEDEEEKFDPLELSEEDKIIHARLRKPPPKRKSLMVVNGTKKSRIMKGRVDEDDVTRYYPVVLEPEADEQQNCMEISDNEFVDLIKENSKNCGKSVVRIEMPLMPSESQDLRVILDSSPEKKTPRRKRKVPVIVKTGKEVDGTSKETEVLYSFPASVIDNARRTQQENPEMVVENEVIVTPEKDPLENDIVHTFPGQVSEEVEVDTSERVLRNEERSEVIYKFNQNNSCRVVPVSCPPETAQESDPQTVENATADNYEELVKGESEVLYTFPDKSEAVAGSSAQEEEEEEYVPELFDGREAAVQDAAEESGLDCDIDDGQIEESEFVEETVSTNLVEEEKIPCSKINYRVTNGMEYAIIEESANQEQKRTYLAGLRPGSFVFMANGSEKVPLEKRCSMYMIAEQATPEGNKKLAPVPVRLPPELMKLISDELNCR